LQIDPEQVIIYANYRKLVLHLQFYFIQVTTSENYRKLVLQLQFYILQVTKLPETSVAAVVANTNWKNHLESL
jgi:hypothetical protein